MGRGLHGGILMWSDSIPLVERDTEVVGQLQEEKKEFYSKANEKRFSRIRKTEKGSRAKSMGLVFLDFLVRCVL